MSLFKLSCSCRTFPQQQQLHGLYFISNGHKRLQPEFVSERLRPARAFQQTGLGEVHGRLPATRGNPDSEPTFFCTSFHRLPWFNCKDGSVGVPDHYFCPKWNIPVIICCCYVTFIVPPVINFSLTSCGIAFVHQILLLAWQGGYYVHDH